MFQMKKIEQYKYYRRQWKFLCLKMGICLKLEDTCKDTEGSVILIFMESIQQTKNILNGRTYQLKCQQNYK